MFDSAALRTRLDGVRDRIARAANRVGRDPAAVRLVAVSKTFSSQHIRVAAEAGHLDFGENKVQEGLQKMADTSDLPLRWHLIGHLQSNKARKATGFHVIHSIDDVALLKRVDEAAAEAGREIDVLVQVDLAGEHTKFGADPGALGTIFDAAAGCRWARLTGLMLLPPVADDPGQSRVYFSRLRRLRDDLLGRGVAPSMVGELSMGMSADFEVAVEEGATVVRVGSAIFGHRGHR